MRLFIGQGPGSCETDGRVLVARAGRGRRACSCCCRRGTASGISSPLRLPPRRLARTIARRAMGLAKLWRPGSGQPQSAVRGWLSRPVCIYWPAHAPPAIQVKDYHPGWRSLFNAAISVLVAVRYRERAGQPHGLPGVCTGTLVKMPAEGVRFIEPGPMLSRPPPASSGSGWRVIVCCCCRQLSRGRIAYGSPGLAAPGLEKTGLPPVAAQLQAFIASSAGQHAPGSERMPGRPGKALCVWLGWPDS